jgi:predicted patatin/cPLA2 family phospholipase
MIRRPARNGLTGHAGPVRFERCATARGPVLNDATSPEYPEGPSATAALLEARKRTRSRPGHREDGRRVALAIEGGGMRGVAAAGMLSAFEQLGMRDCFDVVYGCSAGAIGGAYFIAGQAQRGTTMLHEIVLDRRFINFWRMPLGKPVVSLDFLFREMRDGRLALRSERLLGSDIPLHVLVTSLERKSAVTLSDFADDRALFDALRASARIPFFAGPPVAVGGDRLLDPSLYVSIPFRAATADGTTDIVVLLTRPQGAFRRKPGLFERRVVVPYLRRIDPALAEQYLARAEIYRGEVETIMSHARSGGCPAMFPVHLPRGTAFVSPFELSRDKLRAVAKAGFGSVYHALGRQRPNYT